jgi:hypothetical protein
MAIVTVLLQHRPRPSDTAIQLSLFPDHTDAAPRHMDAGPIGGTAAPCGALAALLVALVMWAVLFAAAWMVLRALT